MGSGVLVLGYGNPGRLDDGLGPALVEAVEGLSLADVVAEADYQLTVENAAQVAESDVVVFADASVNGPEPFGFTEAVPAEELTFSSHSCSPEGVLGLSKKLFSKCPKAYVLSIRGYEFNEFGEELSDAAQANLRAAVEFIGTFLKEQVRH